MAASKCSAEVSLLYNYRDAAMLIRSISVKGKKEILYSLLLLDPTCSILGKPMEKT
jgi:hypothetical protein